MSFLCERCGEALASDDWIYDGKVVCEDCYKTIHDIETWLKYVEDHQKLFIEYLRETLYSPAPYGTRVEEILEDIVHWSDTCVNPDEREYMRFSDWVMRWW